MCLHIVGVCAGDAVEVHQLRSPCTIYSFADFSLFALSITVRTGLIGFKSSVRNYYQKYLTEKDRCLLAELSLQKAPAQLALTVPPLRMLSASYRRETSLLKRKRNC